MGLPELGAGGGERYGGEGVAYGEENLVRTRVCDLGGEEGFWARLLPCGSSPGGEDMPGSSKILAYIVHLERRKEGRRKEMAQMTNVRGTQERKGEGGRG